MFLSCLQHSKHPKGVIDMNSVVNVISRELCTCEWDPLAIPQYCFGIVTPRRVYHVSTCVCVHVCEHLCVVSPAYLHTERDCTYYLLLINPNVQVIAYS